MTTSTTYDVTEAAGLPETLLPASLVATLPSSVAAAPWHTRCEVTSWFHPLDEDALTALPEPVRPAGIATIAWSLVRYAETPVGPYSEVAATLLPADGSVYGHIPFIVVDSLASIVGGRANWLLPKALAAFDWAADGRSVTVTSEQPAEPAWSVSVRVDPQRESAEVTMASHVQQVSTSGAVRRFDGEVSGQVHGAAITVECRADGPLAALLLPGRYDGSVMTDCRFDVGPLDPSAQPE